MILPAILQTQGIFSGAGVDYRDGIVGCMRALMVNGNVMDMRGMVERGEVTYGVSAGQEIFVFIFTYIIHKGNI